MFIVLISCESLGDVSGVGGIGGAGATISFFTKIDILDGVSF